MTALMWNCTFGGSHAEEEPAEPVLTDTAATAQSERSDSKPTAEPQSDFKAEETTETKSENRSQVVSEFSEILTPRNSSAFCARGSVRARVGDAVGAMKDFDRAIELDATNAEAFSGRGYLKLYNSDYQNALSDFQRAIALDQLHTAAYCGRGQVYSEIGHETEAQKDFDCAIKIDPKNAPSYIFRGFHLGRYGDKRRAIADFDQTIRLDPNNALAYCYRASAREAIKDNKGAIEDFNAVIKFDPKYAWAYYWRGHNREQIGERKAAITDFSQYIRLKPDDPWGYRGRGFSRFQSGNPKLALQDYSKAIELDKTDAWTYSARGFVRGKLGDTRGSVADYKQALRLEKAKVKLETKPENEAQESPVTLIEDADVYAFSEKTLRAARSLFGKPRTAIKQLLIFHRPGPNCQTVLWDNDKGIFCIFMANKVNDNYFQGNLGHELVHLLNARLCDPYMEGLCTVFGEEQIPDEDEKRKYYRELVLSTPFYAETYRMMKELESAITKKSYASIIEFATCDPNGDRQWMHIDIDKWLQSLSQGESVTSRRIIEKYAVPIQNTMPGDGTYLFVKPSVKH